MPQTIENEKLTFEQFAYNNLSNSHKTELLQRIAEKMKYTNPASVGQKLRRGQFTILESQMVENYLEENEFLAKLGKAYEALTNA